MSVSRQIAWRVAGSLASGCAGLLGSDLSLLKRATGWSLACEQDRGSVAWTGNCLGRSVTAAHDVVAREAARPPLSGEFRALRSGPASTRWPGSSVGRPGLLVHGLGELAPEWSGMRPADGKRSSPGLTHPARRPRVPPRTCVTLTGTLRDPESQAQGQLAPRNSPLVVCIVCAVAFNGPDEHLGSASPVCSRSGLRLESD